MEQDLSWIIAQTGLPLITIELTTDDGNRGNLCFLIDTGATINIIYKFVCKHFTKSFIEHEGCQLKGKEYSGVFSVIEEYKGMKHIENESGIQVHGVLGMPFLRANRWIVDLDRLEISTRK